MSDNKPSSNDNKPSSDDGMFVMFVTTDQIDAAWRVVDEEPYPDRLGFAEEALMHFGIVRCDECGGDGKTGAAFPHQGFHMVIDCPSCNGHGWAVKDV